jgi:hypothetical protein
MQGKRARAVQQPHFLLRCSTDGTGLERVRCAAFREPAASHGAETMKNSVPVTISLLAALLCAGVASAASEPSWIERSNANAAPLLEIFARYIPEQAAGLGVEGHDQDIFDLKPGYDTRMEADLAAAAAARGVPLATLNPAGFLDNLVPVTLGNIVGGTLLVAGIYWFVYLRGAAEEDRPAEPR